MEVHLLLTCLCLLFLIIKLKKLEKEQKTAVKTNRQAKVNLALALKPMELLQLLTQDVTVQ